MKTVINLLLVMLVGLMIYIEIASAGWDYNTPPKPAQDIIDVLLPVPAATADKYGHTERVRVIYNSAKLIEACNNYELRIKRLETLIKELQKPAVTEVLVKEDERKSEKK